tara:strand:- start:735 stop:1430 length:696 start_codon:yes stop_codon:yes gene_type:complete
MTQRLAVIPARAGSKRIKNKNIREFCGKPMISHILDAAKKSSLFHKIHVSTESRMIEDIVKNLGYEVDFLRDSALADDHTGLLDVLSFVIEKYTLLGEAYDEVWMLIATAPLVSKDDLKSASKAYLSSDSDAPLKAITSFSIPIEWAETLDKRSELEPVNKDALKVRSQDFEKKYYDAGLFYIYSIKDIQTFTQNQNLNYQGFIMPKIKSVDIDDLEDWQIAESFFKSLYS